MTKQQVPYFQLSTNAYGKHWLFYSPGEDGRYNCWEPITDKFYEEFDNLLKAKECLRELIEIAEDAPINYIQRTKTQQEEAIKKARTLCK